MKVRIEWVAREDAVLETALADPRLSFRAKGVLAHLLSLPRGSAVGMKGLTVAASEGKDAIGTALHELSVAGYCERVETVDDESAKAEAPPERENEPVMESLFGQSFGPPVRMSELPESRRFESEDAVETIVERIIGHLNGLRERSWDWAQYTPLSAKHAKNVEHISGRLKDGYAEEDLMLVLDFLASIDGGKEESRRYFNCVTPFNTKNFERNLALARDWGARGRPGQPETSPGTSRGKGYYLGEREGSG